MPHSDVARERPTATSHPPASATAPTRQTFFSTGAQAFLILAAALSPLAVIAIAFVIEGYSWSNPLLFTTIGLIVALWAVAAGLCWLVIDHMLLRSLKRLTAQVRAYRPGTIFESVLDDKRDARELRDLGEAFHTISTMVAQSHHDLAIGLERQRALAREVHHRVKNNLQIVASLISLHSRSAAAPEAGEAYATILRRVDALAVVQRHHFTELEERDGLALKPLLAELLTSLRAGAPAQAKGMPFATRIEPVMVSQDKAIAIAFLLTELVETAMLRGAAIAVNVSRSASEAGAIELAVTSPAFAGADDDVDPLREHNARVVAGLARQLRSRVEIDRKTGTIRLPIEIAQKKFRDDGTA